jgi:hypothetical protein
MNATIAIRMAGREVGATWPVLSTETWSRIGAPSRAQIVIDEFERPLVALSLNAEMEIEVNSRLIFRGRVASHRLSIATASPPKLIVDLRGDVPVPPSSDTPVLTLILGDSILDLDLTLDESAAFRGSVRCEGTALITPGAYFELRRLPGTFDRTLAASGVRHSVKDARWITTIETGGDDCQTSRGA